MNQTIIDLIKSTFKKFNVGIIRYNKLQKLLENRSAVIDIELLLALPNHQASQLLNLLRKSKAQFRQDLFVLSELEFKKNGYFIEFGATNGIDLSNTYMLENEFGWHGVLAEPAKCWHQELSKNRNSNIETNCVWSESNKILTFNESKDAELSTLKEFNASDFHKAKRIKGKSYEVKTISLIDLLDKYNAPKKIDYLSIDTEGSEYEILKAFDFNKYEIKIITCEHNFTPMREKISNLLSQHGYVKKFEKNSRVDSWYVKQ